MALLDNPHAAMYPYHLMNSRLVAAGIGSANGSDLNSAQQGHPMNGYVNGRFDMRIGGSHSQSSSSNRSSTSPNRQNIDTINEDDSSPIHQTVLNATMSLKLESGYHQRFAQNRPTTFRPFSSESPDIDNGSDDPRRDLKVTDDPTLVLHFLSLASSVALS